MTDARTLVEKIEATKSFTVIQEPQIGIKPEHNEFLIFLKPEMFSSPDHDINTKRVNVALEALQKYNVEIDGIIAVNGTYIDEKEIMATHYGLINKLSRNASTFITAEERRTMGTLLGEDCADVQILGGHEALKEFSELTPKALDTFWFTKKSIKVKSGFYFNKYERDGKTFLLVNGFHPFQLSYFTDPEHHVLLFVCHSKTDWKELRWKMIGSTFPEQADPASIRGTICRQAEGLCFVRVDISCNGVHFSVGPFEGVIELNNFIGKILGRDISMETSFARYMQQQGFKEEEIRATLKNPIIMADGKEKDLFGATEDTNPAQALEIYKKGIST